MDVSIRRSCVRVRSGWSPRCAASDKAEFITGTTLLVDGGMTAGYWQRTRAQPVDRARNADCRGPPGAGLSRR